MLKSAILIAVTIFVSNIGAIPTATDEPNYTYVESKIYPGYGVRYVSPRLCTNVTQYAGYLDMGERHHHFWFFESTEDPDSKPLTSFYDGGPGCSSQFAIWEENGPCKYSNSSNPEIEYREQTWIRFSNMLYIDQPTGAGFSYGNYITTSDEGAVVHYEALQLFYEAFPQYSKLPYHLFGESFGGRMALVYGKYIFDENSKLKKSLEEKNNTLASKLIIPLDSVGTLSPWINPNVQTASYANACNLTYGSVVPPEACQLMQKKYTRCKRLMDHCNRTGNSLLCSAATTHCGKEVIEVYRSMSGRHVQDMRKDAEAVIPSEDWAQIVERPHIREALGAGSQKFEICSLNAYTIMVTYGEYSFNTTKEFEYLLDHGVRVLVAAGDADFVGNWVGTRDSLELLNFNGSEEFNQTKLIPWFNGKEEVGQVQSTDLLTFVRIYEAGHEVSLNQPEHSLVMFDNWINKKKFIDKINY